MILFKKGKQKFTLPKNWKGVSFKDGLEIVQETDKLKIFSILAKVPYSELRKETDLKSVYGLYDTMFFLNELPIYENATIPNIVMNWFMPSVTGGAFDLGKAEVGQVEDMEEYIRSRINEDSSDIDILKTYPTICAIYLQKIRDGEYDYDKALLWNIEEEIDFYSACQMGSFFLQKLIGLKDGSKKTRRREGLLRKNKTLALVSLVLLLVFILLLIV